jgi:hypothetical protein
VKETNAPARIRAAVSIVPNRDYYSYEESASVLVEVNTKIAAGDKITYSLLKDNKQVAGSSVAAEVESDITMPLKNLQPGDYILKVALADKGGKVSAAAEQKITKLAPLAGEVKLDRLKRAIVVDGKPYFPVVPLEGFQMGSPAFYKGDWEKLIDDTMRFWENAGIKCVIVVSRIFPTELTGKGWRKVFESAHAHGLRIIAWPVMKPAEGLKNNFDTEFMDKFKTEPSLLSWCVTDEPEIQSDVTPDQVAQVVARAKAVDPRHPVFINFTPIGPGMRYAGLPGDVMCTDLYITANRSIREVVDLVKVKEDRAKEKRMATWMWVVGNNLHNHYREPSAAEQEAETYGTLANGCTGIMYFDGQVFGRKHWDKLVQLNKEIEELSPAIFSTSLPKINSGNKDILVLAKRLGNKTYLFTVNISSSEYTGKFNLAQLGVKSNKAKVMFENRTLNADKGILSDSYKPFERHVYEIAD